MGAGLAGGANYVEQLQALRMTLDGVGNGISVERHHQRYGLRGIFERVLPDQIVTLVYGAAERDTGLLQGAYVAGDAHEYQSLLWQTGQGLGPQSVDLRTAVLRQVKRRVARKTLFAAFFGWRRNN